jgi:hypothetical protein
LPILIERLQRQCNEMIAGARRQQVPPPGRRDRRRLRREIA